MCILSMSVMGLDGEWVGGMSSIHIFLDVWNCFNFAKLLSPEIGCLEYTCNDAVHVPNARVCFAD